jgi:hypothetical protein
MNRGIGRSIPRLAYAAGFLLLFSIAAAAQTNLQVCESTDQSCLQPNPRYAASWSFDGTTGVVTSPASDKGTQLTIDTLSSDKIVIRCTDASGRSATYSGNIQGNHVTGTVQWDSNTTGNWSAIFQNMPAAAQSSAAPVSPDAASGPQGLPTRLIECEGNGPCNGAWTFDGLNGNATWFTQNPIKAKLTIVRVDPGELTIRRTNLTDGNSAVYHGVLNGNTYSGAVIWSTPESAGGASGHWTASIPQTACDPNANLSSADAMRIGQNALMFDLQRDAFDCYLVAAKDGDSMAQTALGLIYYQGRANDIPQDYKQAFYWLKKAADAGVYAAQRTISDMYMLGQGTAKDRELSQFYAAKAAEQKRDKERQEDRADAAAERQKDREQNAMTGFVMGATFGALLFW